MLQNFRLVIAGALASGLLGGAGAQAAAPVTDCPAAKEPYSSDTMLLDLNLDPRAKAVLGRDFPQLARLPFAVMFEKADPPSFGAILSPAKISEMTPPGAFDRLKLDKDLGAIPLTNEAIVRRCARYDEERPPLPRDLPHPAILVFEKINGFRDEGSVSAAHEALSAMAKRRGWRLIFTERAGVFNSEDLSRFDAVVWNNVSGDVLTLPERESLKTWIGSGGGFAAFHGSAGDPVYMWDWYVDRLIGARFLGHPMGPQFQEAVVRVEDGSPGMTKGLPASWAMTEEWYSFAKSPRGPGVHILARLDETSYSPIGMGGTNLRMGDHPIAWTQCIGDGRSFYSAIGHRPQSYSEPNSLRLLEAGISWAAGEGDTRCKAGVEQPRRDSQDRAVGPR